MKNKLLVIILIASLSANVVLLSLLFSPDLQNTILVKTGFRHPSAGLTFSDQGCIIQPHNDNPGSNLSRLSASLQAPAVKATVQYVQRGSFIFQEISQNGAMMNVSVEILPGEGRVLVQTKPLMGVVFQQAANTAVGVAQNRTGTDLSSNDVLFSIEASDQIPGVDGPSAGALMTVLTEAAIRQQPLPQNLTLTGTIEADGHIGAIGGIPEKAAASKESGKSLLLVPADNRQVTLVIQDNQTAGRTNRFRPVVLMQDTKEYIENHVGIPVQYVNTIQDVEQVFFGTIS